MVEKNEGAHPALSVFADHQRGDFFPREFNVTARALSVEHLFCRNPVSSK